MAIPDVRIRQLNDGAERKDGRYVLYWMVAARRAYSNFSLQHAVDRAKALQCPLLVLEPIGLRYQWACDRFHSFVIDGMRDNEARFESRPARYLPYIERKKGEGDGLVEALAAHAALVVTDDFPCFFIPKMIEAVGRRLDVRMEAVDANGLFPMRATDRIFHRAYHFRNFLNKELPQHLGNAPTIDPLGNIDLPELSRLPNGLGRWRFDTDVELSDLPINHDIAPTEDRGGHQAAKRVLAHFLKDRLSRYDEERNHPDLEAASGLSPWLHFGHLGAHEVYGEVMSRGGPSAEAFVDELVTWRELGLNACTHIDNFDRYASLPDWAKKTLAEHAEDPREYTYGLEALARGETHDEVWNAAQRELRETGRLQNYLRMLWGKKILEWTPSPQRALQVMIELNNRYALDGRDPNSYSGIFWVLGRYDRAWGPERQIFGKIRYMSSDAAVKKLKMKDYLARFATSTS